MRANIATAQHMVKLQETCMTFHQAACHVYEEIAAVHFLPEKRDPHKVGHPLLGSKYDLQLIVLWRFNLKCQEVKRQEKSIAQLL